MVRPYKLRACIQTDGEELRGDSIVLHYDVVKPFLSRNNMPLCFRIINPDNGRSVIGFAVKGRCDKQMVLIPSWMLNQLDCQIFDELDVTKVNPHPVEYLNVLIKGSSKKISEDDFKHAIQEYHVVSKGMEAPFYVGGLQYTFTVLDTQPDDVVMITNGRYNVTMNIEDSIKEINEQPDLNRQDSNSNSKTSDLSFIPIQAGSHYEHEIHSQDPVIFEVDNKSLKSPFLSIEVSVNDPELDIDIYVKEDGVPSRFIYDSYNGSIQKLKIHCFRVNSNKKPQRFALILYSGSGKYRVDLKLIDEGRYSQYIKETSAPNEESQDKKGPPVEPKRNQFVCEFCGSCVNISNRAIHYTRCPKKNCCKICGTPVQSRDIPDHTHCSICKKLIPPIEHKKHMYLEHMEYNCPVCGKFILRSEYAIHQQKDCSKNKNQQEYSEKSMNENRSMNQGQKNKNSRPENPKNQRDSGSNSVPYSLPTDRMNDSNSRHSSSGFSQDQNSNYYRDDSNQQENNSRKPSQSVPQDSQRDKNPTILCAFCGDHIPQNDYNKHVIRCGNTKLKCTYCGQSVPRKYIFQHLTTNDRLSEDEAYEAIGGFEEVPNDHFNNRGYDDRNRSNNRGGYNNNQGYDDWNDNSSSNRSNNRGGYNNQGYDDWNDNSSSYRYDNRGYDNRGGYNNNQGYDDWNDNNSSYRSNNRGYDNRGGYNNQGYDDWNDRDNQNYNNRDDSNNQDNNDWNQPNNNKGYGGQDSYRNQSRSNNKNRSSGRKQYAKSYSNSSVKSK